MTPQQMANALEEGYQYIAVNGDGEWWAFHTKPSFCPSSQLWVACIPLLVVCDSNWRCSYGDKLVIKFPYKGSAADSLRQKRSSPCVEFKKKWDIQQLDLW